MDLSIKSYNTPAFRGKVGRSLTDAIIKSATREMDGMVQRANENAMPVDVELLKKVKDMAKDIIEKFQNYMDRLHPDIALERVNDSKTRSQYKYALTCPNAEDISTDTTVRWGKGEIYNKLIHSRRPITGVMPQLGDFTLFANDLISISPEKIEKTFLNSMIERAKETAKITPQSDKLLKNIDEIDKFSREIGAQEGLRENLLPQLNEIHKAELARVAEQKAEQARKNNIIEYNKKTLETMLENWD